MTYRLQYAFFAGLLLVTLVAHAVDAGGGPVKLKSRSFDFAYAATITGLPSGKAARIWIPLPQNDEAQEVQILRRDLPATATLNHDPQGNAIFYLTAPAPANGEISLGMSYRITRGELAESNSPQPPERAARYLEPDALVPVGGKPLSLLKGKNLPSDPMELARVLYDTVDDHMQYRKDKPGWGRGDAAWACDSKFGNCTDFHSLFISLARSEHLPAKFIIGFALPEKHGEGAVAGYHCWAEFLAAGHGWVPVDISEANKNPQKRDYFFGHVCENRVGFTTGRDLTLAPKQDGPPLNYFIYPYVEVDGKPWPAEKIKTHFSFSDQKPPTTQGHAPQ